MKELALKLFEFQGLEVRCFTEGTKAWFVAKDVFLALGLSWKGSESLASINRDWWGVRNLRIPQKNQYGIQNSADNEVIVVSQAAIYKLAFRSKKAEAEAFTNWVAGEVLPAISKTGTYRLRQRERYEAQGKSADWIETRSTGIEARKGFTDTLKDHAEGELLAYPICTNAIYKPVLGGSAKEVKLRRRLPQKAKLRDAMTELELAAVKFAELLASDRINSLNLNGLSECESACAVSGKAVALAITTTNPKLT